MSAYKRKRRRRLNPRFALLCLALGAAAVGVWWANRGLPGEDIAVPDYVERDYIPVNEWSRPGTPL